MKKLILFVSFILAAFCSFSQVRTTIRPQLYQGNYTDIPGIFAPTATSPSPGLSISDTLQVSDTVAYVIPVTHTNNVDFFSDIYWNKIGSGTATITVTYYQSNDPYNFGTGSQLTAGVAKSAYSKTITGSASGWTYINFAQDSVNFAGRYLKIEYMTSSTASVGGKIFTRLKSTIK